MKGLSSVCYNLFSLNLAYNKRVASLQQDVSKRSWEAGSTVPRSVPLPCLVVGRVTMGKPVQNGQVQLPGNKA